MKTKRKARIARALIVDASHIISLLIGQKESADELIALTHALNSLEDARKNIEEFSQLQNL